MPTPSITRHPCGSFPGGCSPGTSDAPRTQPRGAQGAGPGGWGGRRLRLETPDQSHGPSPPWISVSPSVLGEQGLSSPGGTHTRRSNTRTLEPESRVLILTVRPWADGLASLGRGVPIQGRALVDRAGSFNGFPQMLLTPQHTKGFLLGTDAGPTLLPQKDQPPPGKNNFWIQFLFLRGESGVEAASGLGAGGGGQDHSPRRRPWGRSVLGAVDNQPHHGRRRGLPMGAWPGCRGPSGWARGRGAAPGEGTPKTGCSSIALLVYKVRSGPLLCVTPPHSRADAPDPATGERDTVPTFVLFAVQPETQKMKNK